MTRIPSLILRTWAYLLFVPINLLAFYLLLVGHDRPGGGFIAGLCSSASFILLMAALKHETLNRMLRVDLLRFALLGFIIALSSAFVPLLLSKSFMEPISIELGLAPLLEFSISTALTFEIGIFLMVIGASNCIVFAMHHATEIADVEEEP